MLKSDNRVIQICTYLSILNATGDFQMIIEVSVLQYFQIEKGASLLTKDDNGNYPIHSAAKNGANTAIEGIVEAGKF